MTEQASSFPPAQRADRRVVIFSGHMIDAPGRKEPRFPPAKEAAVRAVIERQLAQWQIEAGDLAICGGARGGDVLFAEECLRRGARVRLLLALPREEFIAQSVRLPGSDWVARFEKLIETCEVVYLHETTGAPREDLDVFSRCNLWIIDTARAEMISPDRLFALLVWDEKSTGDGPGGTSDFAARAKASGAHVEIINPTQL